MFNIVHLHCCIDAFTLQNENEKSTFSTTARFHLSVSLSLSLWTGFGALGAEYFRGCRQKRVSVVRPPLSCSGGLHTHS